VNKGQYNPEIHHRRSIRLKGHDYAGGGLYFVTICAHREFIASAKGNPFGANGVREMIASEWESVGAGHVPAVGAGLVSAPFQEGRHEARPYAIMPDHFHALIRIAPGAKSLGDVIGAFKSRVVHEYIAGVKAGRWPRFPGKIWHRNYYEMIVRNPEAEKRIAEYIRMNPWRCVMDFGNGLRGMGNPALWNAEKTGVLCSRNAPPIAKIPAAEVYLGGFHSPPEKIIFEKLLNRGAGIIWCPAWGLDGAFGASALDALEGNRLLILEMKNREGNLAAAEQRNRFVMENADKLWLPHVTPGGMLDRLLRSMDAGKKHQKMP